MAALSFGCQEKEAEKTTIAFEVVDTWTAFMNVSASPWDPLTVFMPTSGIYSACADSCRRYNITPEQLQQVSLSEAVMTMQAPNGQNFDLLRQMTMHIISERGNDQIMLATQPSVPFGATTLTLTPTNAPLLSYLRPGRYYLKPQLELRQPGQTIARVQMKLRFRVQARKP